MTRLQPSQRSRSRVCSVCLRDPRPVWVCLQPDAFVDLGAGLGGADFLPGPATFGLPEVDVDFLPLFFGTELSIFLPSLPRGANSLQAPRSE